MNEQNLVPFKPGQSGNPGGRPKGIGASAREHTDRAIAVLVAGLEDKQTRVRMQAAKELLDRGWGKPVAMVLETRGGAEDMAEEELEARIAELEDRIMPSRGWVKIDAT